MANRELRIANCEYSPSEFVELATEDDLARPGFVIQNSRSDTDEGGAGVSHIEIITIGDELIEGRLVDTNAGLMSERLAAKGLTVISHLSVGDDLTRISAALRSAAARSDAVLVSGGLGPTSDDLTAVAAAAAFDLPIERSPEALEHVRRFFGDRGRRMTENNEKQADLPRGCALLPNPAGTAVGFRIRVGDCRLYFMPGVPRELERMFSEAVLPDLQTFLSGTPPLVSTLKVFGKGESEVAHMLDGLEADLTHDVELTVQYRATFPEIHVRLLVRGPEPSALAELDRLTADARHRIGKYVFAVGGPIVETTFPDAVVGQAQRAGVTIAISDGCTGGELSRLISRSEHAAEVFGGAVVASTPNVLSRLLQLADLDVLSAGGAEAAADRVRHQLGTSVGVAVAGRPLHGDGTISGELVVATSSGAGTASRALNFPVEADRFRRLAAYSALAMVARAIEASRT